MIDKKIIKEKIIDLTEVKEIMQKREKEGKLEYEQEDLVEYCDAFVEKTKTNTQKLINEITEIGIEKNIAINLIDIMPKEKEQIMLILNQNKLGIEIEQDIVDKVYEILIKK